MTLLTNANSQWYPQKSRSESDMNSVQFINQNVGFITTTPVLDENGQTKDNSEILSTIDGGVYWQKAYIGNSDEKFIDMHFINPHHGIAVGYTGSDEFGNNLKGLIVTSRDMGFTWNKVENKLFDSVMLTSVSSFLDTNLLVSGNKIDGDFYRGFLAKSNDWGESWVEITPEIENLVTISKVQYTTPNNVYILCIVYRDEQIHNDLYRSVNNMNGWEKVEIPFDILNFNFLNNTTGMISGAINNQPTLYKTVNSGNSWSKMNIPITNNGSLYAVQIMSQTIAVAIGYDEKEKNLIYRTTDGGSTWLTEKDESGNKNKIHNICFAYNTQMLFADYAYIVGESGKILKAAISNESTAYLIDSDSTLLDFKAKRGEISAIKSVKIRFSNIEGDITLQAPKHFQVSLDKNGEYSNLYTIPHQLAEGNREIFIRYAPTVEGLHSGNLQVKYFTTRLENVELVGNSNVTSVPDDEFSQTIIYPNPANTTINFSNKFEQWTIYDLNSNEISSGISNFADISKLSTGVYYIRLKSNNKFYFKEFIKE
jgi:photosystem II stability/assembly factor-like uncharacterized protein